MLSTHHPLTASRPGSTRTENGEPITMTEPTDDLFGRPTRGRFPKVEELEGLLVLIKPSKVEYGVKGKYGEQTRVTADVVVLDGDDAGTEYEDMYLSQRGLVPTLEKCLKPGAKHPWVLGRISKFPSKELRESGVEDAAGVDKALAEWARKGGKGEKPQFAWGLADFTDADANVARAYIAKNDSFASAGS